MKLTKAEENSLRNILSYLAEEESDYKDNPSKEHIWLDCKRLLRVFGEIE